MAKAKQQTSFWSTMLRGGLYKANQGRKVRQATAAGLAVVVVFGCMRLKGTILVEYEPWVTYGIPGVLLVLGLWTAFRIVNWAPFTDFLIDVEHEMEKVSWASWQYLKRATAVVLGTMVVLGIYLFLCDILWQQLFGAIGFLNLEALGQ